MFLDELDEDPKHVKLMKSVSIDSWSLIPGLACSVYPAMIILKILDKSAKTISHS